MAIGLPSDVQTGLIRGNGDPGQPGSPSCPDLYECFAEVAHRRSGAMALDGPLGRQTYGELERYAGRIAGMLAEHSIGPETVVGLCLERSPELIAAALATVRLGAAYLPLDPTQPTERLRHILDDAGARAVVVGPDGGSGLTATARPALSLNDLGPAAAPTPRTRPPSRDILACVYYTSGSTGAPKGVGVTQRNVLNFLSCTDYLELSDADVVSHLVNPTFDVATFEIWAPLLAGGTVVVIPRRGTLDVDWLFELLDRHKVSTVFLTTALFRQLAVHRPAPFGRFRQVLFAGEAADPLSVGRVMTRGRPGRLLNLYGPTEATTFATWHEVPARESEGPAEPSDAGAAARSERVPIGRPLQRVVVHLLDGQLRPVPTGTEGEIYLGGDSVARGYLGQPKLTAERFVADPYSAAVGQRIYRTGDLGVLRPDGQIEFLGRADDQVKIRGYRIELAEVETVLAGQPGVAAAAVAVWEPTPHDRRLVACVVPLKGPVDADALRDNLRQLLPDFMIPVRFAGCTTLPTTPNGKVDRVAVRKLAEPPATEGSRAPRSDGESYVELVATVWTHVLRSPVDLDRNFFDAGGNSLLLLQVHAELEERLGHPVPLLDLLEHPTITGLAKALQATDGRNGCP